MLPNIISHSSLALWAGMGISSLVTGQIEYDPTSNSLVCSELNGSYCLSESLAGSTMISCVTSTVAEVRSCNIEIASLLPAGYDTSAVCYEPTPESGRALCAFNGTGYSLTGSTTPIPETRLCDFVNPSVAQGTDSKSFVRKTLDSISDAANRLVTRLFPVMSDSSSSAETVSSNQETVYCSNSLSGKDILGQDTTPPSAPSAGARTRTGFTTKARIIAPTDPTLTAVPNPAFVQTHSLRPLGHMIEVTTYFGGTSNGYTTMTAVSTSRSATEPNGVNTTASTSASASLTTLPPNSTITSTNTVSSTNTSTGSCTSSGPVQSTFSLGAAPASVSRVDGSWILLVGVSCLLVMG